MKRLCCVLGLCLSASILFLEANEQFSAESQNSGKEVKVLNLDIIFEDQTLTQEERERIRSDYLSYINSRKPVPPYHRHPERFYTVKIKGEPVTISKVLRYTETTPFIGMLPEDFAKFVGVIGVYIDGSERLVVTKPLSDGYRNAFAAVDRFDEAMKLLPAYLAFLNNVRESLPLATSDEKYIYLYGKEPIFTLNRDDPSIHTKQLAGAFGKHSASLGSILQMYVIEDSPIVTIYRVIAETESRDINVHAMYDQGQWKLFLSNHLPGLPPTARSVMDSTVASP